MADRIDAKVQKIEQSGITTDGKLVFLEVRMDDHDFRIAFDLTDVRQAALLLLAAGDAAQAAAGAGHLTNFIHAEGAKAGFVQGPGSLPVLTLDLGGRKSLTVSLPKAVAHDLGAALQHLGSDGDDPPPGLGQEKPN